MVRYLLVLTQAIRWGAQGTQRIYRSILRVQSEQRLNGRIIERHILFHYACSYRALVRTMAHGGMWHHQCASVRTVSSVHR